MRRRFQFSLRALHVATAAVGPATIVGRWLINLNGLTVLFTTFALVSLAVIVGLQIVLLKVVARSKGV